MFCICIFMFRVEEIDKILNHMPFISRNACWSREIIKSLFIETYFFQYQLSIIKMKSSWKLYNTKVSKDIHPFLHLSFPLVPLVFPDIVTPMTNPAWGSGISWSEG